MNKRQRVEKLEYPLLDTQRVNVTISDFPVHIREKELKQAEKDGVWVLHVKCKVGMAEPTHSPATGNLTQLVASSRANVIDFLKNS
nr:hypothetical protein Iba_chr04aCG4020 [Ipomoea batatas]GMC87913.1 hypothetical protein Iba_chr04eCG5030 [Ipomoea batatas]